MKLGIAEILEKTAKLPDDDLKIAYLQQNRSLPLMQIIQLAYSPVRWALPEGDPPYTPCPFLDQEGMLYSEMKRMYLYFEDGNPNLKPSKRESLFINLLESLTPADAKLLLAVKKHHIPYEGLTPELFNRAFPGLVDLEKIPDRIHVKEVNPETGKKPPGPRKGKKFSADHKEKLRLASLEREAKKKLEKSA